MFRTLPSGAGRRLQLTSASLPDCHDHHLDDDLALNSLHNAGGTL